MKFLISSLVFLILFLNPDKSFAQDTVPPDSSSIAQTDSEGQPEAESFEDNSESSLLDDQADATSQDLVPVLLPLNGTEQIRLDLVNCNWIIDCSLARFLLPASAFIDQWELQFDNSGSEKINILSTAVIGRGEQTGYQLTHEAIAIPELQKAISESLEIGSDSNNTSQQSESSSPTGSVPITLPSNQIVSMPLVLDSTSIPPDRYAGSVYLTIENQPNRMTLPLNLSVRTGPFIPLVVLLIGIILGRVSKFMEERGEPLADALQDLNRLKQDIVATQQLTKEEKEKFFAMVNKVRKSAVRENFEVVEQEIEAVRNRLELIIDLQTMEEGLAGKEQHPAVEKAKKSMDEARRNLVAGKEQEAINLLSEVETAKLTSLMGSEESEENKRFIETESKVKAVANRIDQEPSAVPQKFRLRKILIFLSGLPDDIRAEATLWVAKPVLSLSLLIGLSAVGLNSLYIQNGKTFGANPFTDHFGLILWGLSADIASRRLTSLEGLTSARNSNEE